jgi:hypothetical protein
MKELSSTLIVLLLTTRFGGKVTGEKLGELLGALRTETVGFGSLDLLLVEGYKSNSLVFSVKERGWKLIGYPPDCLSRREKPLFSISKAVFRR